MNPTQIVAALLAGSLAMLAACTSPAGSCTVDRRAALGLNMHAFDQSPRGWRRVADRPGCDVAAADLIAAYRTRHASALDTGSQRRLNWHEAQLRAKADQRERATVLFERSMDGQVDPSDRLYSEATLAFLRRDREALLDARGRLATLPEPAEFARSIEEFRARTGTSVSWPPNLDVVDGLIACFDRPYKEAYGGGCRPAARP